jgi:NADH-quinone oxidoreductase subunit C
MDEMLQPIVNQLQAQFNAPLYQHRGEVSLIVRPDQIVEVATTIRDKFGFQLLSEETAVDYWPEQEPRFHVVYRMRKVTTPLIIGVRVPVDGSAPSLPTISSVYTGANWFEREIFDMFGIRFEGHPDMRRIIMPADWVGHPLRKDSPLGYEEVEFTFNFEEIDLRKPFATE